MRTVHSVPYAQLLVFLVNRATVYNRPIWRAYDSVVPHSQAESCLRVLLYSTAVVWSSIETRTYVPSLSTITV